MKTNYISFCVLCVALAIASCKSDTIVDCPPRDLQILSFDFETNLSDWQQLGGQIEVKDSTFFEISSDTSYSGLYAAKFTVSPAAFLNNGVRSELSFDQQIEAGDVTTYEYSFMVPADYQDVASLRASDGSPNWQIMGQWHDQPDVCRGETWEDLAGNSPPVALYYHYLTTSDQEYLNLLADPNITSIYGFDPNWDNVSIVALEFSGKAVAVTQINKGEWYRIKYEIKWSQESDGYVQAWINNANFTNGKEEGASMLNNASHYFKFGLYRNPTIPYTNSVYYDDLVIY